MTGPIATDLSNASVAGRQERAAPYALRSGIEQKSFEHLFESHLDGVRSASAPEAQYDRSALRSTPPVVTPRSVAPGKAHTASASSIASDAEGPTSMSKAPTNTSGHEVESSRPDAASGSQRIARGASRVEPTTPPAVRAPMAVAPEREAVHVIPNRGGAVEVYTRTLEPIPKEQRAAWIERVRSVLRSFGLKLGKLFLNGRSLEPAVRDRP